MLCQLWMKCDSGSIELQGWGHHWGFSCPRSSTQLARTLELAPRCGGSSVLRPQGCRLKGVSILRVK